MTSHVFEYSMQLCGFFEARAARGESLALITVMATEGSTYSKPGTEVIVDATGEYEGLISGGCLEPDLVARARDVIANGEAQCVDYDLVDDDEVFGLGIGCAGTLRLLIQRLDESVGYEPFASMLAALDNEPAVETERRAPDGTALQFRARRPRRVLLLGAGVDVRALVRFCEVLGWRLTVTDHRAGHIDRLAMPVGGIAQVSPADAIAPLLDAGQFDAAIIVSHHYASDRRYLEQLARSRVPFVGLLGPKNRRDRLLGELDAPVVESLKPRLHAPVGQRIGGRGAAAIALEVVAEMQSYFTGPS